MTNNALPLPKVDVRLSATQQKSAASEFHKPDGSLRASKIMIVDDEPINVKVAQKYLNLEGYRNFVTTTDSREAVALVTEQKPDLLLLDIMMPHVSGLDILGTLRADKRWAQLPIVILTAANDQETKRRALDLGATDFLGKPVDPTDLVPRVYNVLMVKHHYDQLQRYSRELEEEVLRRTTELAQSRKEITHCLARAAEFRDSDMGRHVLRVGRYSRLIAKELGWVGECLDVLEQAAQLHDIGKIGIPDSILLKPDQVPPEEFELIQIYSSEQQTLKKLSDQELGVLRNHTKLGARLLEATKSPILALASTISLSHHEKWDGTGYPLGLAGTAIPIEGRITAVADAFDSLDRNHSPTSLSLDESFQVLESGRGKQFDPQVLDAFFRCRQNILFTQIQYADLR